MAKFILLILAMTLLPIPAAAADELSAAEGAIGFNQYDLNQMLKKMQTLGFEPIDQVELAKALLKPRTDNNSAADAISRSAKLRAKISETKLSLSYIDKKIGGLPANAKERGQIVPCNGPACSITQCREICQKAGFKRTATLGEVVSHALLDTQSARRVITLIDSVMSPLSAQVTPSGFNRVTNCASPDCWEPALNRIQFVDVNVSVSAACSCSEKGEVK